MLWTIVMILFAFLLDSQAWLEMFTVMFQYIVFLLIISLTDTDLYSFRLYSQKSEP